MPHALRSSLLASLWLGALLSGCGGDDGEAGAGPVECTLPAGSEVTPSCESCARGSCSGELSDFCSSGCSRTDTSASCQQAAGQLAACVLSSCAKECEPIAGGAGGGAGAPGASEPGFACYVEDQALCSGAVVSASTRETYEQACTESGGAVREACPTRGLLGCCSYAGGIQTCVYETTAPALERDSCSESGGSWGEPS